MNTNFEIGQKVILDLNVESFVGNICSIDSNHMRIRLKNVENLQTKIKYSGIQNFYFSNIKSIIPLYDDQIQESALEPTSFSSPQEDNNLFEKKDTNNRNVKVELSKQEWDSINITLDNIKLLHQNDVSYFEAIKDLSSQESYVILMEDCNFGRNNLSTIITLYSPITKLVYIFDMICMRKIQKELRQILELEKPRKIMYDSKILCDHLKYAQNVKSINGIFDVLVAYLVTFKEEKSLDLISCVNKYFLIPTNYFKTQINWRVRPLSSDHIQFTAKKAIFLYKLYDYLLHEHLLKQFYQTCQIFSSTYCENNDKVEVAHLMSNNDNTADKLAQETDVELSFSIERFGLQETN
ncbi:protein Exd1 homolog [Condylostylus longicornis]|uniref:protein Exd1 homolog n=1 Tax=Condylostylus longicornis TaxID=2530218 RepID=UPI00244DBFF3|nr:protein Exd1 homolog [Condylostylus longicornis]